MFLLLFTHAAVSFMVSPMDSEFWFYHDDETNLVFDGLVAFFHIVRLPTFFLISGLLTAQMITKYGQSEVGLKRVKRLLLPLLFVVFVFGPMININIAIILGKSNPYALHNVFPIDEFRIRHLGTSYVWFLYYLLTYSAIHIVAARFLKSASVIHCGKYWPIVLIFLVLVTTSVSLFFWKENSLFGQYKLLPDGGSYFGHLSFYAAGVYIANIPQGLERIARKSYSHIMLFAGIVSFTLYMALSYQKVTVGLNPMEFDVRLMVLSNLSMILLSLGVLGVACHYYSKNNALVSYFSQSSYFIYLIHFPVMILVMRWILPLPQNAMMKFLAILLPTIITSLLLNHLWRRFWKGNPPI